MDVAGDGQYGEKRATNALEGGKGRSVMTVAET